ncbi:MAG: efflux RND transporter periplasmic adaptor subunit [Flavobacteriaceae bacterium]
MKSYFFRSFFLSIIILLASCMRTEKKEAKEGAEAKNQPTRIELSEAQFNQNNMQLGQLEDLVFHEHIDVSGMIDVPPQNKAIVSIPVGGYVKETSLLVGDKVRKGQVIVRLENPEFVKIQQQYMEVKARLKYLEAEYVRHQQLYQEKITSEKNFLKSEADFRTAEATLNGLRQQLRLLHISPEEVEAGKITAETGIFAPINGSVSKMNITRGAFISPATEIMEIINTDHIHLELSVFEKDISKIREGQAIKFSIPETSENQYAGSVHRVGSTIDENRRVLVHGHIENPTRFGFLKGMFVNAAIVTDSITRKAIPETAVVEVGNRHFILRLANKTAEHYIFEPIQVEVYQKENGFAALGFEVKLQQGDRFLTQGAFGLLGRD